MYKATATMMTPPKILFWFFPNKNICPLKKYLAIAEAKRTPSTILILSIFVKKANPSKVVTARIEIIMAFLLNSML